MMKQIIYSVFSVFFIFAGGCSSEPPEVCKKLNLLTSKISGATVHYEKCFEKQLTVFEKTYKNLSRLRRGLFNLST